MGKRRQYIVSRTVISTIHSENSLFISRRRQHLDQHTHTHSLYCRRQLADAVFPCWSIVCLGFRLLLRKTQMVYTLPGCLLYSRMWNVCERGAKRTTYEILRQWNKNGKTRIDIQLGTYILDAVSVYPRRGQWGVGEVRCINNQSTPSSYTTLYTPAV